MVEIKRVRHTEIYSGNCSTPFLIAETNDGRKYQVKVPNENNDAMFKEYIANQIASRIGSLTPNGVFLDFWNVLQLEDMLRQLNELMGTFPDPITTHLDLLKNKNDRIILFGVEWLEEYGFGKHLNLDIDDMYIFFNMCQSGNVYKSFSFDQLLLNHDRHIKNFFPCTTGSEMRVYLIDHDRIFASKKKNFERIRKFKNDFACKKNSLNEFLYDFIQDISQKNKITDSAIKMRGLLKDDIVNMFEAFQIICPISMFISSDEIDEIADFIVFRANNLELYCKQNLEQGLCYG